MRLMDNNGGFIGFLKGILDKNEGENDADTVLNKLLDIEEPQARWHYLRLLFKKKSLKDKDARIRILGMLAFEIEHLKAHASIFDDQGHQIERGIRAFFKEVFDTSDNPKTLNALLQEFDTPYRVEIIAALARSCIDANFTGLQKFNDLFGSILAERLLELSDTTSDMSLPLLTERYRHILSLLEKTPLHEITVKFIEDEALRLLASEPTLQKGRALLEMLLVEIAWHPLRQNIIDHAITLGSELLPSPDFANRTQAKTLLILLLEQLRITEVKSLPGDTIKHACLNVFDSEDKEIQDEATDVLEFLDKRRQEPNRPEVDPKHLPQEFKENNGGIFGQYL